MIEQRLQEMAERDGQAAADALHRLTACRGGFTQEAAAALLGLDDPAPMLDTLRAWQFVALLPPDQRAITGRYVIDPLVIAAVGVDDDAIPAHRAYYVALVQGARADLMPELPNLAAAFESALQAGDIAAAYRVYNTCSAFLMQHNDAYHLGWIQQLAEAASPGDESLWGAIQNSLGVAYQNTPAGNRRENLRQAINAYREALLHHPHTGQTYALAQHNLGTAYADFARIEDRAENLWRAIDAYEEALTIRTADHDPRAYAATQHHLGDAYRDLAGVEHRVENLERAIHAYEEALQHYAGLPLDEAATLHSLGNAYRDLAGVRNRVANLRRAIAAYQDALEHRTPTRAPLAYAATQNNLGTAYRALASEEHGAINLQWAITAFKAALSHYSPQDSPLDYAATQNNIGSAYRALSEIADREANLDRALYAFEHAMTYCTPQAAPLDYATTQANLGLVRRDMGEPAQAITAWREALRYFQQMGAVDKADLMHAWIAQAESD